MAFPRAAMRAALKAPRAPCGLPRAAMSFVAVLALSRSGPAKATRVYSGLGAPGDTRDKCFHNSVLLLYYLLILESESRTGDGGGQFSTYFKK